jgi:hypothetical protein
VLVQGMCWIAVGGKVEGGGLTAAAPGSDENAQALRQDLVFVPALQGLIARTLNLEY